MPQFSKKCVHFPHSSRKEITNLIKMSQNPSISPRNVPIQPHSSRKETSSLKTLRRSRLEKFSYVQAVHI
jgi:hypothetical protein